MTPSALTTYLATHRRWRLAIGALASGAAAALAGCVVAPDQGAYYYAPYQAVPMVAPVYPAIVGGTVVYPGGGVYYATPAPWYYGSGVSLGIYGGGGGRSDYRSRPSQRPGDAPRSGANQSSHSGQRPSGAGNNGGHNAPASR
ncbi:MAG: hypothetical protein LBH31_00700 [Burkholderiaceae bacterium]|jgi:hypothetical protein|nr:hypothetical protein [Burkholderiaceae bacterium]